MATTKPVPQALTGHWIDSKFYSLATGVLVPAGTFVCNNAGEAQPATDTLMQGGAKFLGVSAATYDNSAGGSPLTIQMGFIRGAAVYATGKSGDLPVAADVGGPVYLSDNQTVKHTNAGSDYAVTLLEILPGAQGFKVLI